MIPTNRGDGMLKIRLMGTRKDIRWLEGILRKVPEVEVTECSAMFHCQRTDRFYRAYLEVKRTHANKAD